MANKRQIYQVEVNEKKRLMSELPDDIVWSSILSRLTIREVARTCLLSRHWNRIYHYLSSLNCENSRAMQNLRSVFCRNFGIDDQLLDQERRSFVNWMNYFLTNHVGSCIDQFKVTFDFDKTYQAHIDAWVNWALSKHVKILDLDFTLASPYAPHGCEQNRYFLHQSLLEKVKVKVKPFLTCLCLKRVNVTTQAIEHLLESSFSTLENLCIEDCLHLTSITTTTASLQSLKYFKVFRCHHLETLDISAPKLLSFIYESRPESGLRLFHIANASSLARVSIEQRREEHLVRALASLSNYLPLLEHLKLRWWLCSDKKREINFSWPVLANLRHLELCVYGDGEQSLLGWIAFIEACPVLQKLTLQLHCSEGLLFKNAVKHDKLPLLSLKTLEIIGFVGCNADFDIANYVLENGVALQEVILQPSEQIDKTNFKIPSGALHLRIPQGVKLIFNHPRSQISCY